MEGFKEAYDHECFSAWNCKMCSRMSCSVADTKSNLKFYNKSQNHDLCYLIYLENAKCEWFGSDGVEIVH